MMVLRVCYVTLYCTFIVDLRGACIDRFIGLCSVFFRRPNKTCEE